MTAPREFSPLRALLWPIHRHEYRKFLPMLLLFFMVSFNYQTLRNLKDAVVVTAESSGAEVIPFIKVWVMFPMALFVTFIYTRLSRVFTTEHVFYVIVGSFLCYFVIFAFFLYPIKEQLHWNTFANWLEGVLPIGCHGFVSMCRYWLFTSFYVMAEMWSNIVLSVLFWGFANEITSVKEAKRSYALFGLGANISTVVAAQISLFFCRLDYHAAMPFGQTAWEQTLIYLVCLVCIVGVSLMLLYRWIHREVLHKSSSQDGGGLRKTKIRMSMRENFSYLMKSPYVFSIAFIVIAYNISINLLEVIWKDQVKQLYPNPSDFAAYMNQVATWTGVVATIIAVFFTGSFVRRLGWTKTAMMTPIILFATSIVFFALFFFNEHLAGFSVLLQTSTLSLIVFVGSTQNCLGRACKYTVFDCTKEMALIPLDKQQKLKAKAAIDGVGSRLGKSGGSVIHQALLITFATLSASTPYVAAILLVLIGVWLLITRFLGREFESISHEQEEDSPSTLQTV